MAVIQFPFFCEGLGYTFHQGERQRVSMQCWWVVLIPQHGVCVCGGGGLLAVRASLFPPSTLSHCPGRRTWLVVVIREACSGAGPGVTNLSSQGFIQRGRDVTDRLVAPRQAEECGISTQ